MTEITRNSGIDIIGDVQWGTHICQFYQTKEDLLDILVPYFKAGLEDNEFCMWVTSEPLGAEDSKKAMRKAMPDFDQYLKKGQIEIIPHTQWYLKDGLFNLQRVLNDWIDKLNQALSKGYSGMRVTGNIAWLEKRDWKDFTDYEEALNRSIANYNIMAICSYSLDKCSAFEAIDIVSNHQFALIRHKKGWQTIESSERKMALLKYKTILDAAMDCFYIVDAQKGNILEVNDAFCSLIGYSRNELLKMSLRDIEVAETPEEIVQHIQRIIKHGADRFNTRHRSKDGRILDIEVSVNYLRESNIFFVFMHDITDHKKAEAELRKSEERYRIVADFTYDWEFWIGPDGHFLYSSPSCLRVTGYPATDFKKDPDLVKRLVHPEDRKLFNKHRHLVMTQQIVQEIEFRIIRTDGSIRWIYHVCRPVFDDNGQFLGTRGSNRDITKRKQAREDLEAKNVALREVLVQIEIEKNILQKNVTTNIEKLILPTLKKLKARKVFPEYIDLLQRNMEGLTSSFGVKISGPGLTLSPKEIEICDLIKGGYTNKGIAEFVNSSVQTVEKHRKNIRKKLGIAHKKINLATYLQHL